ncbi:hypothetical protein ACNHYB_03625 [Isoptericola jiangsuensis]|uniref:hypothetical protein n=1 Tax=Isoptericola jiangsuensis TaxID=548579 RepID=UPI003AAE29B0
MTALPTYDADQLAQVLGMLPDVDSVELKLTVPGADHHRVVAALGIDVLTARIRQVVFLDTTDLRLSAAGLVIRARRTQGRDGDVTVKLRPMMPADGPAAMRGREGSKVELDASPAGFTCSCSLTTQVADRKVRALIGGESGLLRKLLGSAQRAVVDDHLPAGTRLDDVAALGPVTLLKAKFAPDGARAMTAELWFLPDGSRILELSTKAPPAQAFQAAAETKVLLASHGIDLGAPQETKTRAALAALTG